MTSPRTMSGQKQVLSGHIHEWSVTFYAVCWHGAEKKG